MKVFEVIESGSYEFEHSISTSIYSTREKAKAEWERRVSNAKDDAMNFLDDDERVIEEDAEKLWFDAYKDGEANVWECEVYVVEKEVDKD